MALSEDQLEAMSRSAPLLVAEYRKLQDLTKKCLRAWDLYGQSQHPVHHDWLLITRGDLRDYLGMD